MFRKDQFGLVFNTIFSFMFAIFLPLYMNITQHTLTFEKMCQDFIPGYTVAFVIGTYIDLKGMGDSFARFCRVKDENSLLFHILRVVSITFVLTLIMSAVMMFLSVGFSLGPIFFVAFLSSFPMTFVVALVVAFITFAIGMPLTISLCTKPPRGMPPH